LGLHPDYAGPVYELRGGKALVITTSQPTLAPGDRATGVFASEMTVPYYVFKDGGMQVDVASVRGGAIPIDPLSFAWFVESAADKRFKADAAFQAQVKRSLRIDDVDFAAYDIVYLAGGLGAAKPPPADPAEPPSPRHVAMSWAQRLKRVFGIEIEACVRCGGTLRIIASIEQPERPLGARAPPLPSALL